MDSNTTLNRYPAVLTIPLFCRDFLGVSRSMFYKLPKDERPPTIKIGTKPMIRTADALAWLEAREAK